MGKVLEELIEKNSKDTITDLSEIEKITDELMYSPIDGLSRDFPDLAVRMLRETYLPDEASDELLFGELLCLIRVACCENETSDFAANLRYSVVNRSASLKLRDFSSITIKAFTEFVNKKSQSTRGSFVYMRICSIAENELSLEIQPLMTLEKLFLYFGSMLYWDMRCSLKDFTERARACCLIIKLLMIDCMRFCYGGLFVLSTLKDKLTADSEWEYEFEYECWYGKKSERYDKVDRYTDEYDTNCKNSAMLSEKEKQEWEEITAKLRKIGGKNI